MASLLGREISEHQKGMAWLNFEVPCSFRRVLKKHQPPRKPEIPLEFLDTPFLGSLAKNTYSKPSTPIPEASQNKALFSAMRGCWLANSRRPKGLWGGETPLVEEGPGFPS